MFSSGGIGALHGSDAPAVPWQGRCANNRWVMSRYRGFSVHIVVLATHCMHAPNDAQQVSGYHQICDTEKTPSSCTALHYTVLCGTSFPTRTSRGISFSACHARLLAGVRHKRAVVRAGVCSSLVLPGVLLMVVMWSCENTSRLCIVRRQSWLLHRTQSSIARSAWHSAWL